MIWNREPDTIEEKFLLRTKFVVNPASASGRTGKRWHLIEEQLGDWGIDNFSVEYTENHLHATEITKRAIKEGYTLITAVGGDGTINEVLNGFVEEDGSLSSSAALAFISTGTGGDFNRMFCAQEVEHRLKSILQAQREIKCDIVKAEFVSWQNDSSTRYYINIADLGLGGETCVRINRGSKYLGGFLSFLGAVLATLVKHQGFQVSIDIDRQQVFRGKLTELALANGRYFGGGMMIAPHARIDDGLLDMVIIHDMKKLELLKCLPQLYSGKHQNHPKVKMYQGKRIDIQCTRKVWMEMDGETPGTSILNIELIPAAIRLLY